MTFRRIVAAVAVAIAVSVFQAAFTPLAADSLVVSNSGASYGQSAEVVGSTPVPSGADSKAFDAGGSNHAPAGRAALSMSAGRRAAAVIIALTMLVLLLWINRFALLERAGVPVNGTPAVRSPAPTASVVGVGRFARPRKGSAPPL